jgi:hypothetical protein
MTLLINFKDAVDASALDPAATVAVFYCDGRWPNRVQVAARCPHAKLYAITVLGATGHGIFACDSETGDLPIAQTESWVAEQVAAGVKPIVVYANQDRWLNLGLLAALAKYGDRIERWDADYDGVAAVPSWASAKQYVDGTADLNVARVDFFTGAQPAPPAVHQWSAEIQVAVPEGSTGVLRFHGELVLKTGKWAVAGLPGVVHWSGPGGGQWRSRGIELDAPPLGKA